jgi:hypothetical protein
MPQQLGPGSRREDSPAGISYLDDPVAGDAVRGNVGNIQWFAGHGLYRIAPEFFDQHEL